MPGEIGVVRQETSDDEIVLGVLDAVEQDSALTQRSVARDLGIALGLANAYLNRCIRKGLIKVAQAPARRYAYYLTPQGFAEKSRLTASYLSHSFSFFRKARSECGGIFKTTVSKGQRRLVLIGAGDLAEIASLVAHDHTVEIAGIVNTSREPRALSAAIGKLGRVDAAVVTSLEDPRAAFEAAIAVFGLDRVHVPELLRIRTPAHRAVQASSEAT